MVASILSLILSLIVPVVSVDSGPTPEPKLQLKKTQERVSPTHRRSSTRTARRSQAKKVPSLKQDSPPSQKKVAAPDIKKEQPQTTQVSVEESVINGVHRFYKDARDLRANFVQTYTYTVYDRSQTSSGRVFFKKPGMMRWDYRKPVEKVFVADGEQLWVYEPEENQAFRRKLGTSQLPVALSFMTGTGDLREEFNITVSTKSPKHFILNMVPKKNEGDYKKVILKVDRASFAVQSSTVIDSVGNTNRVVFKGMKTNTDLKDSGFQFNPPSGVRIIKE